MEDYNFLDSILVEVGEFGKFQKRICFFMCFISAITYFGGFIYVFEAKQINHRCEIPGCESDISEFKPSWWKYAIPAKNEEPSKCAKFRRRYNNTDTCCAEDFTQEIEEPCKNFVYETSEVSILHDYNLQCEENVWKLTLVGTIHSVGLFIGLPIGGMLSDRFGRKTMLICTLVTSGIIGITRSFSISYAMFAVLEVLEQICRAGSYSICFILGLELVGPKKRVFVSLLISSTNAIGGIIEGGLAWLFQSWRTLARVLYVFYIIVAVYYWLIPESVRWLLSRKQFSEAINILQKLANVNGKSISEENLKKLETCNSNKENLRSNSVTELFGSGILILRLITCSVCWICCIFLYNGLTINSVELSENSYLDFILTSFVEIPGGIAAYLLVDRIGRRISLFSGFLISGLSCIGLIFIPAGLYWLKLIAYLLGKFGISINISVIYTITTEMFPTPFRNSLLAVCSMFGRIGSMLAPQIPLLSTVWEPLPLTLFGSIGILAAFVTIILPETMNTKLPSTIKEAEDLGKQSKSDELREVKNVA